MDYPGVLICTCLVNAPPAIEYQTGRRSEATATPDEARGLEMKIEGRWPLRPRKRRSRSSRIAVRTRIIFGG